MRYRIGLDIGIGSVGWAVVSAEEEGHPARIEDFGTRIFESGEHPQTSKSLCRERRGFRGVRRLERRRSNRKKMLLNHLKNIGFTNDRFNDDMADCRDKDVYALKVKGLDEKLTPAELYKCLVHTCNHRGYREFYEPGEDDEAGKNASAANSFEKEFKESDFRTVSEYLIATCQNNGFVKFRNREGTDSYTLIRRKLLEDEIRQILEKQADYYTCLTETNMRRIQELIFNQRDFEDGPGDPNDPDRRYHGFIETLGACPFYQNLDRGFRGTVISDVFAVTNTLSQYRYINEKTGEYVLDPCVAEEIVKRLLAEGNLTLTTVKSIAKKHGYIMLKSEASDDKALGKSIKFLGLAKKSAEAAGFSWEELISEEQFDPDHPSLLHRIGELLSTYQTPSRRKKEMKSAGIDADLIKAFSDKRISGTASASYKHMCDAIDAFLNGDVYGNFQANRIKEQSESKPVEKTFKISAQQIDDPDVRNNRVVFKAINETRKVVNAIIDTYGSPEEIVIEVASELGKSPEMRNEIQNKQKQNEKENEEVKEKIAKLLSKETSDVNGSEIERYRLYLEQEGKSAYSRQSLGELRDVVENKDKVYEVDHIIPYSLILDNTLENKALVFSKENQVKGQRTPLMYLSDEKDKKEFLKFVNRMYSRDKKDGNKPISKKKLAYYKLETIYGSEAEKILDAWKSRNINDTRYITKYIKGLLEKYLIFSGDKKQHVFPVKGSVTQKFRREWFCGSQWGLTEKDRSTYLNHALDALIAANLTKPYIEIGSDALRLRAIYRFHKNRISPEYNEYLEKCIDKMKKYYGFSEEYTRSLLSKPNRVPSYVPRLAQEVEVRFNDSDEAAFINGVEQLYRNEAPFLIPPHMPITSQKPVRKFKGEIADSNPIKMVEIDGTTHKIRRVNVKELTKKDFKKIYSGDKSLISAFTDIANIFEQKNDKYTVGKYLKENGLSDFTLPNGAVVREISLDDGVFSNYKRKDIGDGNYTNLSGLKYYCVEVYKNVKGEIKLSGIRYVDIQKSGKKLLRKAESMPEDYARHVMYLFKNDFITVYNHKGNVKCKGYYKSVDNINKPSLNFYLLNSQSDKDKRIAKKDTFVKTHVDILGRLGGDVKCSVPLQCTAEKKSQ